MSIRSISSLSTIQEDCHFVRNWPDDNGAVPIYHTDTSHAFNRIVGYARFINSNAGTVLYRGQNQLYNSMIPSGARSGAVAVSNELFEKICADNELAKFFGLNQKDIVGWKQYQGMLVESVLQHYGAKTYCMDFVDNHWCALWFGLYQFKNNHYFKRTDDGNLYVFLYAADTIGPCVGGMYIGEDTYTVDLRKALPSTFQRPASQHGWVVRKKERKKDNLDDRLIGIIEVRVKDAEKWLGDGYLLSEDNFFPTFTIDQGYKVLLSRQERSGIDLKRQKILPQNTICNYHYSELFYSSSRISEIKPIKKIPFIRSSDDILSALYSVLLNLGWQNDTCLPETMWNPANPSIGQSAATAVLVQEYFGGNICMIEYSSRAHYFNKINGCIIDLTSSEIHPNKKETCYEEARYKDLGSSKTCGVHKRSKAQVQALIEYCKAK